jgi:hypothetical protein
MQYFRPTRSLIVVLTFALSLPGEFAFALQNPDPLPPPPQSVLEQNATAMLRRLRRVQTLRSNRR